jgi:4-amino-4-deoxy-L-arabinose transferase-like glycosyltransferase
MARAQFGDKGREGKRRTTPIALAVITLIYLAFALTYSLLTPAWEPNDEVAHTQYIEYALSHHSIPRISAQNGDESHQPPLYYLMAGVWQRLLAIPAFVPNVQPGTLATTKIKDDVFFESYSHRYSPKQRQQAIYLHELRILSVLLGLCTVVLVYGSSRAIGSDQTVAIASALVVALLPKFLVVSSAVTNDALVIPLCALALFLFLLAERSRHAERIRGHRVLVLGTGVVLGAAAITKFTSLPLAAVLLALIACSSFGPGLSIRRRLMPDFLIALGGFVAVSGWWFLRNKHLYGQYLATGASERYLRSLLFIHPQPWSVSVVTREVPRELVNGLWYSGFANQLYIPHWTNLALTSLALICLLLGGWVIARKRSRPEGMSGLAVLGLIGAIVSGLVALAIVTQTTVNAAARDAFIALPAFAILLILGTQRAASWRSQGLVLMGCYVWPLLLVAVNVYVFFQFVLPFRGL